MSFSITSSTAISDLHPPTHKVNLKLICTNTGNQALNFKLPLQSYPEGLICNNPIQNIFLQPGDRQAVTLKVRTKIISDFNLDRLYNLV